MMAAKSGGLLVCAFALPPFSRSIFAWFGGGEQKAFYYCVFVASLREHNAFSPNRMTWAFWVGCGGFIAYLLIASLKAKPNLNGRNQVSLSPSLHAVLCSFSFQSIQSLA